MVSWAMPGVILKMEGKDWAFQSMTQKPNQLTKQPTKQTKKTSGILVATSSGFDCLFRVDNNNLTGRCTDFSGDDAFRMENPVVQLVVNKLSFDFLMRRSFLKQAVRSRQYMSHPVSGQHWNGLGPKSSCMWWETRVPELGAAGKTCGYSFSDAL